VSNASGQKLLQFLDVDNFEMSAPQCPTHYSPVGNGDVLEIIVNKNTRFSNVIVSEILDSDHLPIIFYIMDHIRTTKLLEPLNKFIDWDYFQSLATDVMSPRIEINSRIDANKAACNFAAFIASAYWLSTTIYQI
jgi:hypothetical protein